MKILKIAPIEVKNKELIVRILFKLNEIERKKIRRHFINEGFSLNGSVGVHSRTLLYTSFNIWAEQFRRNFREELTALEIKFYNYAKCQLIAKMTLAEP